MFSSQPIQAYFSQADTGRNHWGYWAAGLWFAAVVWIFAQFILSGPMFAGIMLVDPDVLSKMPESDSGAQAAKAVGGFVLFSLIAIILYLVRGKFGEKNTKAVSIIAGLFAALSAYCIWQIIQTNDPESVEFIMGYIGKSPLTYGSMLAVFPAIAFGLFIAQRVLHQRSIKSLHTAASSFRWKRMFFSMIVFWTIAGGLSFILHVTGVSKAELIFNPAMFWSFFFVSLIFIPLQSATEEIMLRGYLNQGLFRIIKNPWIVFIITSAGFAALHLSNPEVAEASQNGNVLITVSGYFFFGFFACVLTYIDGGLESAIGVHAANNLFAATVLGYEHSALPTPTIFKIGFNSDADVLMTIAGLTLVCVIMYVTRRNTPGLEA
ncbi:MAG: lysostaphin resistance A-like protein [Maricaulaceae bacterium]